MKEIEVNWPHLYPHWPRKPFETLLGPPTREETCMNGSELDE